MAEQGKDYRHIVRVANTDLDGNKSIVHALRKIKGMGFMFANLMCNAVNINRYKKAGNLTDTEVQRFEEFLKNPTKFGAPEWMLNRRTDPESGVDTHLLGSDLRFQKDNDLKLLKKMKTYKGVRHSLGLTVRGQSTKSNFRKKKKKGSSLGVQRKGKGGKK